LCPPENGDTIRKNKMMTVGSRIALFAAIAYIGLPFALAQKDPPPNMQVIAQSLGVTCEYCHTGGFGGREPEPKKDIARAMIAMTREINEKIQVTTGKAPGESTRVTCITCHHGVAIPGQLSDILLKTWKDKGVDAAIAQYRDLREHYYGKASYDFSEQTLLDTAQVLVRVKPDDAIAMLRLNLEYNPKSAGTYSQIGFAYTRKLDDIAAIENYQKALDLDPANGIVRGQLDQLKSYQRKPASARN
jgi:tetratricopeptide (TPR) repeat protein